jgi:hypothetical protein
MPLSKDFYKKPQECIIGQLSDMREDTGQYGPQVIVEVTPLGEMNPRMKGYNNTDGKAFNRRSGFQKFLAGFRKLGVDPETTELIGKIIRVDLISASFTNDQGDEQDYDIWKVTKIYSTESDALDALQAMESSAPSTEPVIVAAEALGGISVDVLTKAKTVWGAMNQDEAAFKSIAPGSWPGVDVDALIAAIKAG